MYKRSERGWLKHLDFILCDLLSLHLSFILAYWIRQGKINPYRNQPYLILIIVYSMINILIPNITNTMHGIINRGYYQEFIQTLKHVLIEISLMALYMFAVQSGDTYSRIVIFLTAGFHLVFAYLFRIAWKKIFLKAMYRRKSRLVLLVCESWNADRLIMNIEEHREDQLRIVGLVLTDKNATGTKVGGYEVVADVENAAAYISREAVDEVIFSFDRSRELPHDLIDQCREMGVTIHLILPIQNELGGRAYPEKLAGLQVLTNSVSYGTGMEFFIKRAADILGGVIGSLIALIIMAIVGPKIKKESQGSILYTQERIGRKFKMYNVFA